MKNRLHIVVWCIRFSFFLGLYVCQSMASSETIDGKDEKPPTIPPVKSFELHSISGNSATFLWKPLASVSGYELTAVPSDSHTVAEKRIRIGHPTTRSATLHDLAPDTQYRFSIQPFIGDKFGPETTLGDPKTPALVRTLPTPPSRPIYFYPGAVTSRSLTLNWEGQTQLTKYHLYVNSSLVKVLEGTATFTVVQSLQPHTEYLIELEPWNQAGPGPRAHLNLSTAALPPQAPPASNFSVQQVTSTSLQIRWYQEAMEFPLSYRVDTYDAIENPSLIRVFEQEIHDGAPRFRTYTMNNLIPNREYCFWVGTRNEYFSDYWHSWTNFCARTLPAPLPRPPKPENFRIVEQTSSSVKLAWNSRPYLLHFRFCAIRPFESPVCQILSNGTNSIEYWSQDPLDLTLEAVNSTGRSEPAMLAVLAPSQVPAPPTPRRFQQTNATFTSIDLSWDLSGGATSYQVRRSDGTGTIYLTDSNSISVTATDLALGPGQSVVLSLTACKISCSYPTTLTVFRGVRAPTNVQISEVTPTSARVTWVPPQGASTFRVLLGDVVVAVAASPSVYEQTLLNLHPDRSYVLRVDACASIYCSTSEAITFRTPSFSGPTDISVTLRAQKSLTIAWPFITGASNFRLSVDGNYLRMTKRTSAVIDQLQPNREYLVGVQACNSVGDCGEPGLLRVLTLPPQTNPEVCRHFEGPRAIIENIVGIVNPADLLNVRTFGWTFSSLTDDHNTEWATTTDSEQGIPGWSYLYKMPRSTLVNSQVISFDASEICFKLSPAFSDHEPRVQRLFINFNGSSEVLHFPNYPLDVQPFGPFDAADIAPRYAGLTEQMKTWIVNRVREHFMPYNIDISTSNGSPPQLPYSTLYVGSPSIDDIPLGLASTVDRFNKIQDDYAIVFAGEFGLQERILTPEQMSIAIANTASHEIGHLLGLEHTVDNPDDIMNSTGGIYVIANPNQSFRNGKIDEWNYVPGHSRPGDPTLPRGRQDSSALLKMILGPRENY